jgi:hypothetical protein
VIVLKKSQSIIQIGKSHLTNSTVTKHPFNKLKTENKYCILPIHIPSEWDLPINIYYELNNFFNNHRAFVRSRDIYQLSNQTVYFF